MKRALYLQMSLEQLQKEVMRRFAGQLPPITQVGAVFIISFTFLKDEYTFTADTIYNVCVDLLVGHDNKNTVIDAPEWLLTEQHDFSYPISKQAV